MVTGESQRPDVGFGLLRIMLTMPKLELTNEVAAKLVRNFAAKMKLYTSVRN